MKEKYIEERFPPYFILGQHKDGRVDIATMHNSTIATVSKADALTLMRDRTQIVDILTALAFALDKVDPIIFDRIWYGNAPLDKSPQNPMI
jgi:hypothetical protein